MLHEAVSSVFIALHVHVFYSYTVFTFKVKYWIKCGSISDINKLYTSNKIPIKLYWNIFKKFQCNCVATSNFDYNMQCMRPLISNNMEI